MLNNQSQTQAMFVEEYYVAHGFNPHALSNEVNSYIKKGFIPYGEAFGGNSGGIFQPMIRLDKRVTDLTEKTIAIAEKTILESM